MLVTFLQKNICMLGKKLHDAIKESGISMAEVARYIGISETNLYRILKKDTFEVAYLQKAATILKLPITYFLEDTPAATISQTGFANISGTNNKQKIMPGAESTGRTTLPTNTPDLAAKLADCEKDKSMLTRELEVTRELVRAKDEMILLLRGHRDNPN